jgi:hypothetical protein
MERVVDTELYSKLGDINMQLAAMLSDTQRALAGEREFGVEHVRALSEPIAAMASVMERAAELRKLHPEIGGPLDLYKSQLRELETTLEQMRMMLLARRSQMDAGRVQLEAVSQWANAFGRTR